MPVIRTQQRVAGLAPGETLEVHCTDPGCVHDIPAWCRVNGHTFLGAREDNGDVIIRLQVGEDSSRP